jgi:hypothetical protein
VAGDKYGIPPGGNNGAWGVKYWKGLHYTLPWPELMASIALGGWPRELWGMAGAVAAAESSRNPFIYNTYKKGHFGLFQISRDAWPDFFAESRSGGMEWLVPSANAKQGYAIYQKQGWGAWEGKTNGGYLAYYPQAMSAAADLGRKTDQAKDKQALWKSQISDKTFWTVAQAMGASPADVAQVGVDQLGQGLNDAAAGVAQGTVDAGGAAVGAVGDMAQVVTGLWQALTTPALWMRLAYGATGIVLVGGGLFLIVRSRPAVQQTAAAVTKAATATVGGIK